MTITASVIADSISPDAHRITTMVMRYPRFIHAEFMTHRVFSRNASSSRAIPIEKMIRDVIEDPAMPVAWGSNKPGMQAGDEIDTPVKFKNDEVPPEAAWCRARDNAVTVARAFAGAGYHKQIVNRILEPFAHITVICTATDWDNFFELRCHPDADPTMRVLAEAMREARDASVPEELTSSWWHLPYITDEDWSFFPEVMSYHECAKELTKISAARCARVSYLNHDGTKPDIRKDLALAERLASSKHMSPFEHQARVTGDEGTSLWGNFTGWDQYRKMIE